MGKASHDVNRITTLVVPSSVVDTTILELTATPITGVNPLNVALVDGSGTQITSFGGGTQYTEDAAAAANPVGTAPILVRKDTPSTTVTNDGDNIAQRGTDYGAAYVTLLDTGGSPVAVGGGTQYTEDAVAAANPIGTAVSLIRSDTPATQTTTDGDNVAQRGTNYGAAYVQLVTSAGAYIDSVGGGTEYTEDVATANPIVGKAIMVERDDALATVTPIEGDNIGLRGTAEGALWTQDFNSDGILADTTAIKTAVEILDNAIAGTEMQVDVVGALPAGTNNIGDVDIVSGTITTVSTVTNLSQMGGVAISLNTGVRDAGTQRVTIATNDAVPVTFTGSTDVATQTTLSALNSKVTAVNTGAVVISSGAVTETNSASSLTSLQLIDDTIATLGTTTYTETSTKGTIIGAIRRDADTTLVDTTNEVSPLQVDANGRLKVEAFSGETLPVSLTSTTVTGTVAVTQSGTWDEVGINDSGNSITVDYATTGSGTATGALRVELPTNGTGTVGLNAGTNAIGKLAANSGVDIGDVDILSIAAGDNNIGNVDIVSGTVTTVTTLTGGGIAHDSADSGNPHKIGYKAYSPDGTTPGTAVAEGDRTDAKADLDGRQLVNVEHPRWWSYHENSSNALTDTSVQSAPGAGFQIVVTEIMVSTGAATALNVFFEEGSTKVLGPWYLEAVAGRGLFWKGNKHITANTALTITTSAAIAHSVDIQGYIQAV
jgi:hypothetical protein